nr:hypothetical protein [Candidatus Sigynarchaeota archaeon]
MGIKKSIKSAVEALKAAGYRVKLARVGGKTRIRTEHVKTSKAFRRKAFDRLGKLVHRSKNAFRQHGYWRRPG